MFVCSYLYFSLMAALPLAQLFCTYSAYMMYMLSSTVQDSSPCNETLYKADLDPDLRPSRSSFGPLLTTPRKHRLTYNRQLLNSFVYNLNFDILRAKRSKKIILSL
jgi:hypothetical protein